MKKQTLNCTLSALFLAMAILLPFLTASNRTLGNMLLPMHLPIILCGYICGPFWGMATGLCAPILRSLIFGMPKLFPSAIAMAVELCAYAGLCGAFYKILPKKTPYIYLSLGISMVLGRIIWGAVSVFLYGLGNTPYSWSIFISGALLNSYPGIILQFILIPPTVRLIDKKIK